MEQGQLLSLDNDDSDDTQRYQGKTLELDTGDNDYKKDKPLPTTTTPKKRKHKKVMKPTATVTYVFPRGILLELVTAAFLLYILIVCIRDGQRVGMINSVKHVFLGTPPAKGPKYSLRKTLPQTDVRFPYDKEFEYADCEADFAYYLKKGHACMCMHHLDHTSPSYRLCAVQMSKDVVMLADPDYIGYSIDKKVGAYYKSIHLAWFDPKHRVYMVGKYTGDQAQCLQEAFAQMGIEPVVSQE